MPKTGILTLNVALENSGKCKLSEKQSWDPQSSLPGFNPMFLAMGSWFFQMCFYVESSVYHQTLKDPRVIGKKNLDL